MSIPVLFHCDRDGVLPSLREGLGVGLSFLPCGRKAEAWSRVASPRQRRAKEWYLTFHNDTILKAID